jgi:glycosyltransferase involved in cell wall biosynthesis
MRNQGLAATSRNLDVISFIVPAHNEEALIGRTLLALHEAGRALGEPYEIVVANDASTDRTGDIAREHGARVVAVNRRQIAATRNAGARAATGELFFFVDADTVVTAAAVGAAVRTLRRGTVGGGCSRVRFDGPVPPYGVVLEWLLPTFLQVLAMAPGCFLFCTRQAYLGTRGFNEALYVTEEIAFANRLKCQGRFVMLRELIFTSGRKIRSHTPLDLLRILGRLLLGGRRSLERREGLDYWYGQRADGRHDTCKVQI